MSERSWKNYHWTYHALEKIAKYNWCLGTVFEYFRKAIVVDKSDYQLLNDFVKHGGMRGYSSKILMYKRFVFVLKKKTVVTVYKTEKEFTHRMEVDGKEKFVPFYKYLENKETHGRNTNNIQG